MTRRQYPYYVGRERYKGDKIRHCAACISRATHSVTIQLSIFRGDDDAWYVCEEHALMARHDYPRFASLIRAMAEYRSQDVVAKHEETGREWRGTRRNLPPRYVIVESPIMATVSYQHDGMGGEVDHG